MTAINKSIIDAKLTTLSSVQAVPQTALEIAVRAKFQKEVDTNNANITKLNTLISTIQAQLNK